MCETMVAAVAIRQVRWTDLPVLKDMITKLAAHHGDVADVRVDTLARDVFGAQPWARVLIAERDGEVVGYAMLGTTYHAQWGRRGCELQHLFVQERWRGRGVGRALIEATIGAARGLACGFLVVSVHPGNAAAAAIYAHLGFARRGGGFRMEIG